jgi:hypothetical protein
MADTPGSTTNGSTTNLLECSVVLALRLELDDQPPYLSVRSLLCVLPSTVDQLCDFLPCDINQPFGSLPVISFARRQQFLQSVHLHFGVGYRAAVPAQRNTNSHTSAAWTNKRC